MEGTMNPRGWIDNAFGAAHIGFILDAKAAGTFTGMRWWCMRN